MLFASVVMAVVLFVVLLSWAFQRRLIYLPSTGGAVGGHHAGGARDVQLTTSDGLRLGVVRPARRGAARSGSGLCWHDDRSLRAPLARALANRFRVLLFDYRGYAETRGAKARKGWLGRPRRTSVPHRRGRAR